MYLSKLELHGFKSFAGRTQLQFDPGITAVVGPNGCGKSNIVDAVRWVIGEQRARVLRSEKMENVIFNGTAKRRPLGMSEVKLTIENTRGVLPVEYSEVVIGRRLYRSGESEYLLNGVQCRLKDITDLFMDTGMGAGAYSVIELKMIEEILSDNAQDRRRLFEEAAGITKYKLRRAQTMRKLDATQVDLTRLRDLVEEIERRVRSLKRQAKKAARYRELEEELRSLELALAWLEYSRLEQQRSSLDDEIKNLHDDLEGQNAQQGKQEAELESLRMTQIEREELLLERESELQRHVDTVRRIEGELRLLSQRLDVCRRDRDRNTSDRAEALDRSQSLESELDDLRERLAAAKPELEARTAELEKAREERDRTRDAAEKIRSHVQETREMVGKISEELATRQRQLDRLESRNELLEQDRNTCAAQIEALQSSVVDVKAELETAHEAVDVAQKAVDIARSELTQAEERKEALESDRETATEVLRRVEKQREAAAAEVQLLSSLVTSYDDFSEAVQYLAERSNDNGDHLMTVADVVACDAADRLAVDAALGDMAACIVVETEEEAVRAMNQLRTEDKGRATFLVLSRLRRTDNDLETHSPPIGDLLASRVRVQEPYGPVVRLLLHNCLIADDDVEARLIAAELDGTFRVFSRTGEWVDSRGLLHGGSANEASSGGLRLGRREQLEEAKERFDRLDEDLTKSLGQVRAVEAALADVQVGPKRELLTEAERGLADAEKVLARVEFRRTSFQDRAHELESRLDAIADTRSRTSDEIRQLETEVKETKVKLDEIRQRRTTVEAEFHEADAESRAAMTVYSDANLSAVQKHNEVDNLERDVKRNHDTIEELTAKAARLKLEIEALDVQLTKETERQSALKDELEHVRSGRPDLEQAVTVAKNQLMETKSEISSLESELRKIRQSRELQMREENTRAIRLAEIQTRMEDLVAHIAEDFDIDLMRTEIEVPEDLLEGDAREKVHTLRDKIRGMGPVNALALEEYEQEKERYDFLSAQLTDLEKAEETLKETITEINATASARFEETFEAIRVNFCKLFADLFGGEATADVVLEEPSDPLESAIEVFARPRGKRPSVLAQLSGGEKTLTAIALLFAIYLVKPSPFCILDEVDAPLDDANIARFMKLIRTFAETTQFILVTHNKRTMEAADRMYGVTMQEQGVSSLVGVRFEEATESEELQVA